MINHVTNVSDAELRAIPDATDEFDSEFMQRRILDMEWRIAERQVEATHKLAEFTERLVGVTTVLWIVAAVLLVASIAQILVMLKIS